MKGHVYSYWVERKRVDGKSRRVKQQDLGRADPVVARWERTLQRAQGNFRRHIVLILGTLPVIANPAVCPIWTIVCAQRMIPQGLDPGCGERKRDPIASRASLGPERAGWTRFRVQPWYRAPGTVDRPNRGGVSRAKIFAQ
ncbi:MAG: hypothetical protein C7B43_09745 [Sulfobacillus benefaciens]|uniref:Uncharacterized protein n=1 Tax=Sulfobacillus benefaciens TaxID=453960 RepID=A0A2T2X2K3_9FIRM|nr:MAG: hypothetical protein C7B43_09745 [Sulfobacillus benefaciens]